MHYETTIVHQGDAGMPSVRAIATVIRSLGKGCMVIGDFEAVRIPHPPPLVRVMLHLAHLWESAHYQIENWHGNLAPHDQSSVTAEDLHDFDIDVHPCGSDVHMKFTCPLEAIFMDADAARELAGRLEEAAGKTTKDPTNPLQH